MSSEPPKKKQRVFASFGPVIASENSHVHQIGALHSVNTYINTTAVSSPQPDKSLETESLESLLFNGIYSKKRSIEHTLGTCSWLLEHPQFLTWTSKPNTVLWLEANPGAGKSTLTKFAAQHDSEYNQDTVATCSFFFNALGEGEESTMHGFLSSVLHELSMQHPSCLKTVTQAFQTNCRLMGSFKEKWKWTMKELKSLASNVLRELSTILTLRMYVDAIDEAQDADDILDFLDDLLITTEPATSSLNVFISCRHHPNLKRTPSFVIDLGYESREDLEIHAKYALRGLRISDERKVAVQQFLVSNANRIFQWLVLVLPQVRSMLQDGHSDSDVQQKLHDLPAGLDALYSSLIETVSKDHRPQSLKLFQWLCFSYGPLNLSEIRVALAVDQDDTWATLEELCSSKNEQWIEDDSRLEARLKSLSKGLICYVERGKSAPEDAPRTRNVNVVFIHQSVQDFMKNKGLALLSQSINEAPSPFESGHTQLYRSCLKYMALCSWHLPDHEYPEWIPRLYTKIWAHEESLALCEYSIFFWGRHAKELTISTQSRQDEIIKLLERPSILLMERLILFDEAFFLHMGLEIGMSVLHMCSYLGLTGVVERLVSYSKVAIDARDYSDRTPLSWAAQRGETEVFRTLLNTNRADPHSETSNDVSPVATAIEGGNIEIVQLLLEKEEFDPNQRSSTGLNPLVAAVLCDQVDIIRLLLSSDKVIADVRYNGDSILFLATAHNNSLEICRLLLDTHQIDPNQGRDMCTPLHMAAMTNQVDLVQLLINTPKVQLEPRDEQGRTPLHCAAKRNHIDTAQVLINTGRLNLMLRDDKGRTALHLAAKYLWLVVKLLLETGQVDPLSTDELGRTPLHLAAMKDNPEAVSLLLKTELIYPMAVDALGNTPLFYALDRNCWRVVELLDGR